MTMKLWKVLDIGLVEEESLKVHKIGWHKKAKVID